MSVFEIVRGVEGNCLVLDGTRICGPKPWGGGRIIKHFETDGIYEVIDKDEYHKLLEDNAKLRELCRDLYECASESAYSCPNTCKHWSENEYCCSLNLSDRMSELGIEVE